MCTSRKCNLSIITEEYSDISIDDSPCDLSSSAESGGGGGGGGAPIKYNIMQ